MGIDSYVIVWRQVSCDFQISFPQEQAGLSDSHFCKKIRRSGSLGLHFCGGRGIPPGLAGGQRARGGTIKTAVGFWKLWLYPTDHTVDLPSEGITAISWWLSVSDTIGLNPGGIIGIELGKISQAKVAEIAGLCRAAFIDALRVYQVPAIQIDPSGLEREFRL